MRLMAGRSAQVKIGTYRKRLSTENASHPSACFPTAAATGLLRKIKLAAPIYVKSSPRPGTPEPPVVRQPARTIVVLGQLGGEIEVWR